MDNYIISVKQQESPVKTALVIPPIIFGKGRGSGNQRSMQIPDLAKATLKRQRGLRVGPGESRWGNIHIQDLSRLFLRLVEKAAEGDQDDNIWGANGVFFTGVGEMVGFLMRVKCLQDTNKVGSHLATSRDESLSLQMTST